MSREDTYTDSCAITMNKMAKSVADRMDRACRDWEDQPELCDLWRMYKWLADVEEAHSKMIHGNVGTRKGVPAFIGETVKGFMPDNAREIMDEITEINERLSALTEEWKQHKWRLSAISDELRKAQQTKDEEARKAAQAEAERKKEVDRLRNAAYLGMRRH